MLEELRDDPSWTVVEMPLCDDNYKSYWPAYRDDAWCKAEMERHRVKGRLSSFYMEYMCNAVPTEDATFRQEVTAKVAASNFKTNPRSHSGGL